MPNSGVSEKNPVCVYKKEGPFSENGITAAVACVQGARPSMEVSFFTGHFLFAVLVVVHARLSYWEKYQRQHQNNHNS